MGVCAPLCLQLELLGLSQPMEAQSLAWPHLYSGEDAVLVSEAGSGKTLAYLLPLLQRVMEDEEQDRDSGQLAVVVPTQDLAVQVLRVARTLCDGGPLTCADVAGEARGAHVLVGTPPDMLRCLGRRFRDRRGTLRLVLDEADLLLSGVKKTGTSGDRPVVALLDGVKPRAGTRRPKPVKGKAAKAERAGAKAAKKMRPGDWLCPDCGAAVFASKDACFKCGAAKPADAPAAAAVGALPPRGRPEAPPAQLVLVSATIPAQGGKSVGTFLSDRFPTIRWLRSEGAHKPLGQLTSAFVEVESADARRDALLALLGARQNRTMVFANSAAQAEGVRRLLEGGGVPCGLYHPNVPPHERRAALTAFEADEAGVLVCSGLGGRGIDVSGVGTVVQYTLAPHMVEYMHRVGRTGRAGRPGHAVSLVNRDSQSEQALVAEVQRCERGSWKFV